MFDTLSDDSKDALRLVPILLRPYSWTYKITLLCIFYQQMYVIMATIKNLGVKMLALTLGMGKRRIFFYKKMDSRHRII